MAFQATGSPAAYQDSGGSTAAGLVDGDQHVQVDLVNETGTWGYNAGSAGTVTLTGSKRVLGIGAIATSAGATISIDSGDSIPVPTDVGFSFSPRGNLTDPEIVFTGTASYFVEYVT